MSKPIRGFLSKRRGMKSREGRPSTVANLDATRRANGGGATLYLSSFAVRRLALISAPLLASR